MSADEAPPIEWSLARIAEALERIAYLIRTDPQRMDKR